MPRVQEVAVTPHCNRWIPFVFLLHSNSSSVKRKNPCLFHGSFIVIRPFVSSYPTTTL
jgi:hypothetical protein